MVIKKELKVLDIDYAVLSCQLEFLWAQKQQALWVRDRYYDTWRKWYILRLRCRWDKVILTQKIKKKDWEKSRSTVEKNIMIDNIQSGFNIMKELGLDCTQYKEKMRISYHIDTVEFDMDFYEELPILLEIKWQTTDQIYGRARRLWLQYHTITTRWSKKLFAHYSKKLLCNHIL